MTFFLNVRFRGMPRDASVEAAAQRWGVRLEAANLAIRRAAVAIEPSPDGRRIAARVTVELANGATAVTTGARDDAHVAVGDAFRAARRQLLAHSASDGHGSAARAEATSGGDAARTAAAV
jgi:hypothetical protein